MRWSYKTVHYELKKEGFLGQAFLDEAEVEQSLNEYGSAGWELVSMMETQDGLIAIFKQPFQREATVQLKDKKIEQYEEITHVTDEEGLITESDIIEDEESADHDNNGLNRIRIE